jgi:hypothetical protein
MNSMKKHWGIFCILVCMFLATGGGCKKSTEALAIPVGMLMEHGDCKETLTGGAASGEDFAPGPFSDCIDYRYNGVDVLDFTHVNAGLNCCPGDITGEIGYSGNRITITEREGTAGCHCMCLYDLDYRIVNMVPGQYIIRIVEPNIGADDQALELTLNLSGATSGSFCLPRNHYPWI